MSLDRADRRKSSACTQFAIVACLLGTAQAPQVAAQGASSLEVKLGLEGTYSDNFYYESANERSVTGAVLSPTVEYTRDSATTTLGLTAKGDFAAFNYGTEDNYADGLGSAALNFKLPRNLVLGFTAIAEQGHDPFGTARTEGQPSQNQTLDEWSQYTGSVALVGGQAERSRLGFELGYASLMREYQSNEASTQYLDRTFNSASATLLYHFTPKLSVLAQGTFLELDYDHVQAGTVDRAGDATIGLVGVRWDATAKTSGDIRIGRGQWQADSALVEDIDSSYYDASINWNPTKRSSFRLSGAREYSPTYRFDAVFIDAQSIRLQWSELWSYRWSTALILAYSERDFVGANEKHEVASITGRLTYQLDRDLRIYVSSRYLDRDAVNFNERFETNTAIIGLEAKLN